SPPACAGAPGRPSQAGSYPKPEYPALSPAPAAAPPPRRRWNRSPQIACCAPGQPAAFAALPHRNLSARFLCCCPYTRSLSQFSMSTFIDGYPSVLTKSRSFIAPWLQITINRQKTQVETWRETPQFVPKISTKKEIFSI